MKLPKISAFLPDLDMYLHLGPVSFRVGVLARRFDRAETEWFAVEWVFFRWRGGFRATKRWGR